MAYDFVVVGGGIGGLTTAALLATRGRSVCLLERQSQVGGCIARVEFAGHDFEPGMGLYSGFGEGEVFDRLFSELKIEDVIAKEVESNYVVRLPDADFEFKRGDEFDDEVRRVFPECSRAAIEFFESDARPLPASERFHSFIGSVMRAITHRELEQCPASVVGEVIDLLRGPMYEIQGGVATLAERLELAIRSAGGTVKLNSPVLRLAFNESGAATGVDLLSGERIEARRGVISNLTIWDTFGKLIGLNRTPLDIKRQLAAVEGSGAYLIYASMESSALPRLPGERFMVAGDEEFTFAVGSGPVPPGKVAVTLKTRTDVDDWFRFHSTDEDFEEWDQSALEEFWNLIHSRLPELGSSIEVLETANPRTFYDLTRRKLGMVMGTSRSWHKHTTAIPALFIIGDTISTAPALSSLVASVIRVVQNL